MSELLPVAAVREIDGIAYVRSEDHQRALHLAAALERIIEDRIGGEPLSILDSLHEARDRIAELEAENARLQGWLMKIDAADSPSPDATTLRRWAFEALTLGKEAQGDAAR